MERSWSTSSRRLLHCIGGTHPRTGVTGDRQAQPPERHCAQQWHCYSTVGAVAVEV